MNLDDKIYIAGHNGMVGSAIWRVLKKKGYRNLIGRSREELDLCDQYAVNLFFEDEKPDYVFLAAALVGGIYANNTYRADFIYENLAVQNNVISAAARNRVKRLLFLGSSCIYPRDCQQPIKEEYLLTGPLEPTNEPYAVAKIAGLKMCEAYNRQYNTQFMSVMPTNLYGPNDNYDLEKAHVLPSLIRKFVDAKRIGADFVTVWGTGNPRREFLHVDDAADAIVFLMNIEFDKWKQIGVSHINIGAGEDITINDLADMIKNVVGYEGDIRHDFSQPDGMQRKLLDVSRLETLGWRASIELKSGIEGVVYEYQKMCHGLLGEL